MSKQYSNPLEVGQAITTRLSTSGQKGSIAKGTLNYLPIALSLIAGIADVTSWLTLSGLFSAHITGNLVIAMADWIRGELPRASQILAIPIFIMGVVFARLSAQIFGVRRGATIKLLLFEQFLLLACAFALAAANGPSTNPNSLAALLVGMFAVTAMAVQNALLHLVRKQAPSTAVMTGNIVVSTLALIDMTLDRGSDRSDAIDKWKATWPLLAGFLAGCIAGATAVSLSHDLAWLLPAVASLILVLCWGSPKNPLDVRGSARRRHRSIE
jgi:uncharacterized membrane protein YoaK (UPF0700 family)